MARLDTIRALEKRGLSTQLAEKTVGDLEFDLITGFDSGFLDFPENIKVHPFLEKDEFLEIFKNKYLPKGS